ncbi:MAG: hypothetical protein J6P03_06565, partial [Opitutales bacterium]|nr:hypothetical protein [Opitutales bacterium]
MTIDKLLIIDYIKEEAGEFIFDPTSNVIFSAENTAGKTCLFKSIYYAIGLDVKSFPESWDYKKMIFKAYCNFEGEKVTITRLLNSFYINDNPKSLNSKDYAAFLATKIKAHIKLPIKSNKKMMDVYPSVYILPFYIDQDDSWTDELYKDSASNMEMYVSGSIPNKIFEYLFQIENDAIISKEEELSKLKNLSTEIKSRQNVLSSLKKHFVEFPSISCALNEEDAKNEINDFLKELDKVNNSVCELKQKIYELQKKIDEDKVEISELDKIINITSNSLSGIQLRCSHCHTQLTLEQALTRMELKHNKFEIQHLKNHLSEKVSANLKELSNLRSRKLDLDEEYRKLACIINTKRNNITLQEYIEEKSKLYSSKKYSLVDDDLKEALSKNKKEIKDLNKEIKQLKAETKERKDIIENTFLDLRNSFSLSF